MMPDFTSESGKIEPENLKSYFYQSLSEICERRNLDSSDSSLAYIVNLLCDYSRSARSTCTAAAVRAGRVPAVHGVVRHGDVTRLADDGPGAAGYRVRLGADARARDLA